MRRANRPEFEHRSALCDIVNVLRAAGDVVRHAFGDLGSAGGHRAMAKAVIRLRDWRAREGDASPEALARTIVARFTRALRT